MGAIEKGNSDYPKLLAPMPVLLSPQVKIWPHLCNFIIILTPIFQVISDAYFNHSLAYDNPSLTFVSFDFHEYCRGMHFENISVLVDALEDQVRYSVLS